MQTFRPGVHSAWIAVFRYGCARHRLRTRQIRTSLAAPAMCNLRELHAWRTLGALAVGTAPRSSEARWALRRRRPRRFVAPKFHPTAADRMAAAVARWRFRHPTTPEA